MRRKFAAPLAVLLGLGPAITSACDLVPLGGVYTHLQASHLGGPDAVDLRELHLVDLNGDDHLDAYAVTTFWVSGGAGDAGGVLYFEGREGGVCAEPYAMSIETGAPDSIQVTALAAQDTSAFPHFKLSYIPVFAAKSPDAPDVVVFAYDAAGFGFAPLQQTD